MTGHGHCSLVTIVSFSTGLLVLGVYFVVDIYGVGQQLPSKDAVQGEPTAQRFPEIASLCAHLLP